MSRSPGQSRSARGSGLAACGRRARAFSGVFAVLIAVVAVVTLHSGCRQAEGERCQVDEDCLEGLRCCRTLDPDAVIVGGVCKPPGKCEFTEPDAGVADAGIDATTDAVGGDAVPAGDAADTDGGQQPDGSVDGAAEQDATASDGSPETDAAASDAAASDAAASDAAGDAT